jgi:tRNA (guanine-N7-)-methyltransferase
MSQARLWRLRSGQHAAFTSFPPGGIGPWRFHRRGVDACLQMPKAMASVPSSSPESSRSRKLSLGDHTALRELYGIDTPADSERAAQVALHHVEFLPRWLSSRPIAEHTVRAFCEILEWRRARPNRPIILDSGCGTGRSSGILAHRFPAHDVIGIDRNASLLRRAPVYRHLRVRHIQLPEPPSNLLLVRADLVDLWRLAQAAGWKLDYHYLLYPNPYPKPSDIKSRIYGHPVFPILLGLGGRIEVRTSWEAYCIDFAAAATAIKPDTIVEGPHLLRVESAESALTNFEAKYHACFQPVFRLIVHLSSSAVVIHESSVK